MSFKVDMKVKYLFIFVLYVFISSCEDVEVAYPGNNQSTKAVAPSGTADWLIPVVDGAGQLDENSATGVAVATLNAEDGNPDDEFIYSIASQTIDNTSGNYFRIDKEEEGDFKLVLNNGSINYESLSGSKEVQLVILVEDDSPDKLISNFSLRVEIINVNESPYFINLSSIAPYADEYVEFSSGNLIWDDIDEGDNPTLNTQGPGWLNISNEGLFSGAPSSSDVGVNSFVLTISDDDNPPISVSEEVNIEVRENVAPIFINAPSSLSIKVGCWDANESILVLNWSDPNNSAPNFTGNDLVTFSFEENISWLNISDDGNIFCVDAPQNTDAAVSEIEITVEDNRPNNSKSLTETFDVTVIPNDAPSYTNLNSFADEMDSGTEYIFELEYDDPNDDLLAFELKFAIGNNVFNSGQLGWVSINNSGEITLNPTSSNAGDYTISFIISDECFEVSEEKAFTIR
tara:strand:- start:1073 stop:2449 length:1377 start_codon:yes stop_codon:yes gene_type:complete